MVCTGQIIGPAMTGEASMSIFLLSSAYRKLLLLLAIAQIYLPLQLLQYIIIGLSPV